MEVRSVTGANVTNDQASMFTSIIRQAYSKTTLNATDHYSPENVYFYLEFEGDTVAFGSYLKIEGIVIDDEVWPRPVHGRSMVAVLERYRGRSFGTMIVCHMNEYARSNDWSQVGIHGKRAYIGESKTKKLSEFYERCGLEVDRDIGDKLYVRRDGMLNSLSHTNISYRRGDPFIDAVRLSERGAVLPYSW